MGSLTWGHFCGVSEVGSLLWGPRCGVRAVAMTRCSPGSAAAAPSSPPCGPRTLWAVSSPPRGAPHCGTAAGWAALRPPPADPTSSPWTDPMGGRGGEWGRCPTAPRSAAPSLGSPRPQVEVLFPIYGGGNGVCGAPPFCGSGGPFRVLWGLCPTSAPTPHVGGAGLGVPPPSGRGLRLAFLILWGLSPTSPIPPQIPSMGGAGLGVPPSRVEV